MVAETHEEHRDCRWNGRHGMTDYHTPWSDTSGAHERLARERVVQDDSCQDFAGRNPRNRRLLLTTNTLLNAIAALATTGDSSQDIANGIAATL